MKYSNFITLQDYFTPFSTCKTRQSAIENSLLALWLADQVTAVVEDEHKTRDKAFDIAKQNLKK